ncbi:MAG: hypothetical protein ACJAVV_001800 [Alphaproteobacteria bacterium]
MAINTFFKQFLYKGNKMNITIASFALFANLVNVTSLPIASSQVVPSQTATFSKNELVKILETEQQTNQQLDSFTVNVPNLVLNNSMLLAKTATAPRNSATLIVSKKIVSADE